MHRIGFGGGCHWCTEAVFESIKGVQKVEQGFITPKGEEDSFSEAVIVHYDPSQIPLKDLIEIHLWTHKSTSEHSMRGKYRSAVYAFDKASERESTMAMVALQAGFRDKIITQIVPFGKFKPSDIRFQNYFYSDPNKPFCEMHISPKLKVLRKRFGKQVNQDKINTNGVLQ